ncbi:scarecrow-like protein 32 [Pyrus ussuriensis x Pyrus communis]|uniref:Scarecrow-like protein 32 n=1 Tax=Pyrus ussuriensis x Pyrus communis TaxID=2448454 RepID=A0A5N5GEF4_9ROSA|nr:scarecrow-like protein 32 [Pyrus ussuriensis x Pyrus communis]
MKTEVRGSITSVSLQNPSTSLFTTSQGKSLTGALTGCLGSLDGGCIEKLLLHCASALESNDVTLAQQVMWVLNNVASSVGDPNQRLTSWILRALISRASKVFPTPMNFNGSSSTSTIPSRLMSVTELAGYVDLIPWHRFGYCASNSAIFKAIEGCPKVHILDFSITHCMQWPTLIDALEKRPEGPPLLRSLFPLEATSPPLLNVSSEEVGLRLGNFSRFRNVPFEFNPLGGIPGHQDGSMRNTFLNTIRSLNPRIIVVVDEDSDLTAPSLCSRITTCFNYLWIPFDSLETFLPKDSTQRMNYESDVGHKIENIIGFEGQQRIERLRNIGFSSAPFCEETAKEVKALYVVLTWKGHNSVFATAWVPNPNGC